MLWAGEENPFWSGGNKGNRLLGYMMEMEGEEGTIVRKARSIHNIFYHSHSPEGVASNKRQD